MEERTFSSFEIMRALEIPKEKLRDWIDRGFIKASKPSPGRGRPAGFTKDDVYELALFMVLISKGFPRDIASGWGREARSQSNLHQNKPTNFILFRTRSYPDGQESLQAIGIIKESWRISLSHGWIYKEDQEETPADLNEWDTILIVNYRKIRARVDAALAPL
jgi:hypothetical protein